MPKIEARKVRNEKLLSGIKPIQKNSISNIRGFAIKLAMARNIAPIKAASEALRFRNIPKNRNIAKRQKLRARWDI
jgi:hypothetical protein